MTSEDGEVKSASDGANGPAGPAASAGPEGRADGDTAGDTEDTGKSKKDGKGRPFWKEFPILIVVALVLAVLMKTFVVQAFYIPSGSMENTLRVNDRVLVNKLVYHTRDIHRGDVIVFKGTDSWAPEVTYNEPTNPISKGMRKVGEWLGTAPGERDYIKRVIGVGGDRVSCAGNGAPILVNGKPLSEKAYLFPGNQPSESRFSITVPKGHLWVMGDHRAASADSRAHRGDASDGTIPVKNVVGRAFVIVWPVDHWSNLPIPSSFK